MTSIRLPAASNPIGKAVDHHHADAHDAAAQCASSRLFIRITAAAIIDMLCAMPVSTRHAIATGMVLISTNTSSIAYQAIVATISSRAMRTSHSRR